MSETLPEQRTIPVVLAYMAGQCIKSLRRHEHIDEDYLAIEITFKRDALARVAIDRPEILRLDRLLGIEVTYPEREATDADWMVTVIDQRRGPIEIHCSMWSTTEALLDSM